MIRMMEGSVQLQGMGGSFLHVWGEGLPGDAGAGCKTLNRGRDKEFDKNIPVDSFNVA